MGTIIKLVVIFYVIMLVFLYLCQRKLLYFPTPGSKVNGVPEVSFDADGATLHGWVVNEGRVRALIYYGGNAERIEDNIEFFENELPGYTVYLVSYRGYGQSGGKPTEENLYKDALLVYDRVTHWHRQISLMGRSLGTGVAIRVASKRPVARMVLVTPYDSIENLAKSRYWMFPISTLLKDKFEAWRMVKGISVPTLVLVAENDQVIPRVRTESLLACFERTKPDVVIIRGANHNTISEFLEFAICVRDALKK